MPLVCDSLAINRHFLPQVVPASALGKVVLAVLLGQSVAANTAARVARAAVQATSN